jgi:hypothetical protein
MIAPPDFTRQISPDLQGAAPQRTGGGTGQVDVTFHLPSAPQPALPTLVASGQAMSHEGRSKQGSQASPSAGSVSGHRGGAHGGSDTLHVVPSHVACAGQQAPYEQLRVGSEHAAPCAGWVAGQLLDAPPSPVVLVVPVEPPEPLTELSHAERTATRASAKAEAMEVEGIMGR